MPTGNEGINTADGSDRTVSDVAHTPGVDVAAGEAEFKSLNRQLSKEARDQYNKDGTRDPEKILEDEDFDLMEYLSTTNDMASQAGIKRKRIGVVWENLEVLGQASMSLGVRTFPDAVIQNFGAPVFAVMKVSERAVERSARQGDATRLCLECGSCAPAETLVDGIAELLLTLAINHSFRPSVTQCSTLDSASCFRTSAEASSQVK